MMRGSCGGGRGQRRCCVAREIARQAAIATDGPRSSRRTSGIAGSLIPAASAAPPTPETVDRQLRASIGAVFDGPCFVPHEAVRNTALNGGLL